MSKVEKTIESTARVLAALSSKDGGPSKSFQLLIRQIGETKTKHVSPLLEWLATGFPDPSCTETRAGA